MAGASSSSKAINNEVLNEFTFFEWITEEINELKQSDFTMLEAEALKRVALKVANFMQEKYADLNEVGDIPLVLDAHIKSIYANPVESTRDFIFINHQVKKLLVKLVNWKKEHQAKKKTQKNQQQEQKPILNSAPLQNSTETRQQISSVVAPLFIGLDSDEDESPIEENRMDIAKNGSSSSSSNGTNSTRKQPKSTAETINQNGPKRGNGVKIAQQRVNQPASKPINKSAAPPAPITVEEEPKRQQNLVEVKKEIIAEEEPPTEHQQNNSAEAEQNDGNEENMDDGANRYMRSSLQEECLENLFSKDSPEDVSLMNEKEQQQISGNNVKEEIMSEEHDDGTTTNCGDEYESEDGDDEGGGENKGMDIDDRGTIIGGTNGTDVQQHSISPPNSVNASLPDDIQMNGNDNELLIGSTSKNSPQKIRQLPKQEAVNVLEKIHGKINIDMEIDRCKQRKRRLIDESTEQQMDEDFSSSSTTNEEYSDFSHIQSTSTSAPAANLPWHKNAKSQFQQCFAPQPPAPKLNNVAKPPLKYSDKIKKKLRVDYENEQKAKKKAARKTMKVRFSKDKPVEHTFEIEEGNKFFSYKDGSPTSRKYVQRTQKFINFNIVSNHQQHQLSGRQLTFQMQTDIKSMIEAISQRDADVREQQDRQNNHEPIWDEYLVRTTRLLITDSVLAKLDENSFRNMQILKLNGQKNFKIFVDVLGQQLDYIRNKKNLPAMLFSYIFILDGFDAVNEEKMFDPQKLIEMRKFFVDKLAPEQLPTEDGVYRYAVPQFVLITIPPMADPNEKKIQDYNNALRQFAQENNGDFLLLDWAKQIEKMSDHDAKIAELIVRELVKMLGEFGVLVR